MARMRSLLSLRPCSVRRPVLRILLCKPHCAQGCPVWDAGCVMDCPAVLVHVTTRQDALKRVREISSRRAELRVEIGELLAEEATLRRQVLLRRRTEVLEASAYQVVAIHVICITMT